MADRSPPTETREPEGPQDPSGNTLSGNAQTGEPRRQEGSQGALPQEGTQGAGPGGIQDAVPEGEPEVFRTPRENRSTRSRGTSGVQPMENPEAVLRGRTVRRLQDSVQALRNTNPSGQTQANLEDPDQLVSRIRAPLLTLVKTEIRTWLGVYVKQKMETTGEPIMERIARKELEAFQSRVVPEVVSHLLESAILMDPLAQVIREEVQVELAKQATTFPRHPNAGPSVWQPTGHTTTVTDPIRQY